MCTTPRLLAILVALMVIAAACGGDDDGDAVEETPTPTVEATPTPTPDDDDEAEPTPTPEPGPVWPLTGMPVEDPAAAERPALAVKIDNNPDGLPQWGINQADVMLEVLVEGITRLVGVYHSADADPIGPIRSGRSGDPDIVANFGRPLLAWSGGNPTVMGLIAEAQAQGLLIDVGAFTRSDDVYYRYPQRLAPHNLLSSTQRLFALAPDWATPPPQLYDYRTPGDAPGRAVDGVTITFTSIHRSDFVWDPDQQVWLRWQNRSLHADFDGVPVRAANVVVLETTYGVSSADPSSPESNTIGEGAAWVYSEGHLREGRWVRPTRQDPWQLVDSTGEPLTLVPGQTWIELAPPGTMTTIDADTAATLLGGYAAELEALQR